MYSIMNGMTETRNRHHYVSKALLKNWAPDGYVWSYDLLVPDQRVPHFRKRALKSVAFRKHLFHRTDSTERDQIERWFDSRFENRGARSLQKAVANLKLEPADWIDLIDFLALHRVRAPAQMSRYFTAASKVANDAIRESVAKVAESVPIPAIESTSEEVQADAADFPVKVYVEEQADGNTRLGAETYIGRRTWLGHIRRALQDFAPVLREHRWTIVKPYRGFLWPTSDNPVVQLHFRSPADYSLEGGWARKNANILFPLGPEHLMITQVGVARLWRKGHRLDMKTTQLFTKFIVENAHRTIFAAEEHDVIKRMRSRKVDIVQFEAERKTWQTWHDSHSAIERKFSE